MEEDVFTREVKQRWRKRQRERQKSNRLRLAKQQLCTCITLFRTFLCRHYTTSTWKCLISRFVETVSTKERLSISFCELRYRLLEFNSRKKCQHLKNWTRWNKRDKVWISGNSLLKWPSRCRRRRAKHCRRIVNWPITTDVDNPVSQSESKERKPPWRAGKRMLASNA